MDECRIYVEQKHTMTPNQFTFSQCYSMMFKITGQPCIPGKPTPEDPLCVAFEYTGTCERWCPLRALKLKHITDEEIKAGTLIYD